MIKAFGALADIDLRYVQPSFAPLIQDQSSTLITIVIELTISIDNSYFQIPKIKDALKNFYLIKAMTMNKVFDKSAIAVMTS